MSEQTLLSLVEENTISYGKEVLNERALVDFRDGCKPIHRRILWGMYKMGMHHNGGFKKAARVLGEVVGKLHPHSSDAVYGAMVTIANSSTRLLHPEGNWGDAENPKSYAAFRYTLCKLSEYSDKYLLDPDYLAITPMVKTYDGENEEPVFLPAKVPNLLVNGTEGIAVAVSCYIPSFSLESVIELCKIAFKRSVTAKDCLETLEFKFPYGGIVTSSDGDILEYFKTGKATLTFSPKIKVKGSEVIINEIPPRLKINPTKQNPSPGFIEKISALKGVKKVLDLREKQILEFKAILNNSYTNDTIKDIRNILTVSLPFQTKITVRSSNGEDTLFKQCTIPDIVNKWVKWRTNFEVKMLSRLLNLERERLDKNELMILIIANLDIVKRALEADHFQKYLIKHLDITEDQAKYVEGKTLSSLTKVSKESLIEKVKESKKKIKQFKYFIENPVERILETL